MQKKNRQEKNTQEKQPLNTEEKACACAELNKKKPTKEKEIHEKVINETVINEEQEQKHFDVFPLLTRTFAHAKRVELFADQLFHSLHKLHKLSLQDNKLLCTAAYLHDLGWIYGRQSHNKISGKIIREFAKTKKFIPHDESIEPALQAQIQAILEKNLHKFNKNEIILISLIARYHRKAEPSQRHKYYCDLSEKDKARVRVLSGIIRVADALDYTHTSAVKMIDTEIEKNEITLNLHCDSQYIAEKERVNEKKQLLQETLKKVLTCQIKSKKEKS